MAPRPDLKPTEPREVRRRAELMVSDAKSWPGHARKGEGPSMTKDCPGEISSELTEVDRNIFEIHVDVGMGAEIARATGTISR
jgi:hypothetical protein